MATNTKIQKNYGKGYLRMGLGALAILVVGVVGYIAGLSYIEAGFPLRYAPPYPWWEVEAIGLVALLMGAIALAVSGLVIYFTARRVIGFVHRFAGFLGGPDDSDPNKILERINRRI